VYGFVRNQTCPSDTAYVVVQVTPKPGAPTVPPVAIDYCQFAQAAPLSAGGSNIRWFSTPTGGLGSATAPVPNTQVPGTYYFYASQTVRGCESDRAMLVVNVIPKPAPPKVTSPLNLCQDDPVGPLTAIGQNLLWYSDASGGVGVSVPPIPNTGYEDSFQYWVTQTVNGCESDRALIQVYVNYKPNGVVVAASQSVCEDANDTFFYYGNARPDAQYVWSAPKIKSHVISGDTTPGPFIVHFDSSGTSTIHLQINNKGCISTLISAPITVRPLPKIDYSLKRDVCLDELVNIALVATEPDISTYSYDFGSSDTTMVYGAPPGGPFGIRYHSPGDYVVAVTATRGGCTSRPLEKRITVHDLPDAAISAMKFDNSHLLVPFDPNIDILCSSDTIVLSVRSVPEGAIYTWSPTAFFQTLEDSLNNHVRAVVNRTSYVKVNVRTAFGCEANDSILVNTQPCCGVYFPTVFSPNARNEVNRTFKPITEGFHIINNFRVVNRWGQVVFETKVEKKGWDGTYNGVAQDMGVYYWYISYKCEGKNMEQQGEVTLMR
jgi:gliding motility-associated-like protein